MIGPLLIGFFAVSWVLGSLITALWRRFARPSRSTWREWEEWDDVALAESTFEDHFH
ncbi:hypothetical protein [Aggregatilinea lenta]|uniref:hypothetical protein n=1 Tax=Aggregatilinea lenta TaxID=913108 RepID=UPI0013C2F6B3|nr:hypothetical protein [Aggregatilinea lenta]